MLPSCKRAMLLSGLVLSTAVITWLVGASLNWAQDNTARDSLAQADGGAPSAIARAASHENDYELLRLFVDTLDQVERNYVKDVSRRELVEAAIQGMLSKLDQHTNYISPQELDQFKTGVESEFGGIGIHVNSRNGELTVVSPVPGSPAHRGGLKAGDVITHVEAKPIKGLMIDEATRLLKGKAGSSVEFTVRHADGKSEVMKLKREVVKMDTVLGWRRGVEAHWDYWADESEKIGYIRISSFSRHTAEELKSALEMLKKGGVRGLVLDLRLNPGGLLSSAIEVSDLFVSQGRIVSTSGRNVEEKKWEAQRRGTFEGFPIAVLVNRASASASEIVAACLQDHHRAVIVGERTWGKGSVQNVVELEGGHSALKLTTAKYYRPSGKDIHRDDNEGEDGEWGVQPDPGYEVKSSVADLHELSAQFRIREQLNPDGDPADPAEFEDLQLSKAREYLNETISKSQPDRTDATPAAEKAADKGAEKAADKAAEEK